MHANKRIVVQFRTSGTEFCVSEFCVSRDLSSSFYHPLRLLPSCHWVAYEHFCRPTKSRSQFAGHSHTLTLRCTNLMLLSNAYTLSYAKQYLYCVSYKTNLGHLPESQNGPQWRAKPTPLKLLQKVLFSLQSMPTYLCCSTPKSNAVQEEGLTNNGRPYLLLQWNDSYPNFSHPNTSVNWTTFQFTVF